MDERQYPAGRGAETYGGTAPAFAATVNGLVNGDTFASLGGTCAATVNGAALSSTTPAGSYPGAITCSGVSTDNYTVSYTAGTLTINQAPLTVTATHDPISNSDPATSGYIISYSGWVGNDSATSGAISGSPSCYALFYTPGDPPGTYAIRCALGSLSSANYYFVSSQGGNLAIPGGQFVGFLTVTQGTTLSGVSGPSYGGDGNFLTSASFSNADLSNANPAKTNLKGATGPSTAMLTGVIWAKTTCPDNTSSNQDGGTCVGHV